MDQARTTIDAVNLAELSAAGHPFTMRETVAVVRSTCLRLASMPYGRAPHLAELWVGSGGEISIAFDPGEDDDDWDVMAGLARLLEALLPPLGSRDPDLAVPASLRVLAPRARGREGLRPLATPARLADELARYEREPAPVVLQSLFARAADRYAGLVRPIEYVEPEPEPEPQPERLVAEEVEPLDTTSGGAGQPTPVLDAYAPDLVLEDEPTLRAQAIETTPTEPEPIVERTSADEPVGQAEVWLDPADAGPWSLEEDEAPLRPAAPVEATRVPPLRARQRAHSGRRPPLTAALLLLTGFVLGAVAMRLAPAVPEPQRWFASLSLDGGDAAQPPADAPRTESLAGAGVAARQAAGDAGEERDVPSGAPTEPATEPTTGTSGSPDAQVTPDPGAVGDHADGFWATLDPGEAVPLETPSIEGPAFSPAFSPDGSAVLFHVGRTTEGRLMRATFGDSAPDVEPVLEGDGRSYHPRPSPDGQLVAFDSDRDGVRGVYIARPDGSAVQRVSDVGYAAVPSWSPDMRWLAFIRAEPKRPRVWNLWLRNMETGEIDRLTSHRVGQMWGASWFPDSRRVCYSHEDRIIVHDVETGASKWYRTPRRGRLVRTPAVDPMGRRVVFQVQRDGVWLLELQSGGMRKILADVSAEEFSWDPDGRRFAYHSQRDGEWRIWVAVPPADPS